VRFFGAPFNSTTVRCIAVAGALALSLLCSSQADAAGWRGPLDLSATGADATEPALAVSEAGNAVVAWRSQDGSGTVIKASTRPAGSSFSTPVSLSGVGPAIGLPQVALNAAGDAVAVWRNGFRIEVATRPAGSSSFSSPESIPAPGPTTLEPQVAIDPAGEAVVAWLTITGGTGTVETSTRPAGESFTAPAPLFPAHANVAEPRLAVTAAGEAIVVWRKDGVVEAATRPAGDAFSITPLSAPGGNADHPRLAVNAAGSAILVWKRNSGVPAPVIEAVTRGPGDAFSAPAPASAPDAGPGNPDVALNSAGNATVAWTSARSVRTVVEVVSRPAGGSFSAAATLTGEDRAAFEPQVALNALGAAAVVWQRQTGGTRLIEAATRSPSGSFTAPVTLSAEGQSADAPRIALDAAGEAIAVWSRSNGTNKIVQAALYNASGPRPGNPASTNPPVTIKPTTATARVGRLVKLRGGKALVSLSCPPSGSCQGTAKLTAKRGGRRLALGKRSFQIAAGKKLTLAIKLSAGARLLIDSTGRKGLVARLEGSGVQAAPVRLAGGSR
jgi:hypothetical protein